MTSDSPRRVLITGASSGVGAAAADRFARAGYDVALLARSEDGLEAVARTVRGHGGRALVVPADVGDRAALADAVATVQAEFGGLDVVVVNAAITIFGPFAEVAAEDFDRVVQVTFLGTVNVVRLTLPLLEDSGGVVVSVGSLNSRVPLPAWSSYCAAKHATRGFLNTLSLELQAQKSRVRIAQLHPGAINTPVWEQTATATDYLPRRPPEAYDPEQVGEALVRLAANPRKEVLFGAEAVGLDQLWSRARPLGDLVLRTMFHYFGTGHRPAQSDGDALREAVGKGIVADGILQRPSLTSALRGLAGLTSATLRLPSLRATT
jgi:NAD(P)-dependent dehydrogenase (short-subunit alcohol dehydrogenase family)